MTYLRHIICVLVLTVLFVGNSTAQSSFFTPADTLNKGRLIGVSTGVGTVWAGSMIGLWQFWYKDAQSANWHSFDDSKNWLQMDKTGHFYTAYKLNQLNTDLFRWSGLNRKTSLWLGTGISFGYQATLELLDAKTIEWGFSWSDMAANTIGTLAYLGQQLAWDEERIIPKFSYNQSEFARIRPNVLGSTWGESLLKDYNGQTYWLSFSPGTFTKRDNFPEWLCFSVGYSAHEKLVGDTEYYQDPTSGNEYYSQREFLFSMDIDFSRIPIKKPWLRVLLKQLNYLKMPFPSLIIRDGKALGSWTGY
jgi:hypothetical protein